MDYSNAVGLAIRDVENTGGIDEDAVRPRERASKRIGFGTVAALARAEHGCDDAGLELDATNDVVLGVCYMKPAACTGKAFGTCELR